MPQAWSELVLCLFLCTLATGCGSTSAGEEDTGDVVDVEITDMVDAVPDVDTPPDLDCMFGATRGVCLPEPPRGTPDAECPSGQKVGGAHFQNGGVCLPQAPISGDSECPSGSYTSVEGMSGPGVCDPLAPVLTDWTCPMGWSATPGFADVSGAVNTPAGMDAFQTCLPPSPAVGCAAGTLPLTGSATCATHGSPCMASGWPDETVLRGRAPGYPGTVLYVDPNATPGGDGSRALPLATLFEALAASADDDIIALSAGVHVSGPIVIDTRLAVLGVCPANTVIEDPAGTDNDVAITLGTAAEVVLRDFTLQGPRAGIWLDRTANITAVSSVHITGATRFGIEVSASSAIATLEALRIDDVDGDGLRVLGSDVNITGVVIQRFNGTGLFVQGASAEVDVTQLLIRDTVADLLDDAAGIGIHVTGDGNLVLRESIVSGGTEGIWLDTAAAVLEDTVVERQARPAAANDAHAVRGRQCDLQTRRVHVRDVVGFGVQLVDCTADFERVAVHDIESQSTLLDLRPGWGIHIGGGTTAISEMLVERVAGNGVYFLEGAATASDVVIRDMAFAGTLDGYTTGHSMSAIQGTQLSLSRALFERGVTSFIYASWDDTVADLQDITMRECDFSLIKMGVGESCYGVEVNYGADADIRRIRILNPHGFGIASEGGSQVTVSDAWLKDEPHPDARAGVLASYIYSYAPTGLAASTVSFPLEFDPPQRGASMVAERVLVDGFSHNGVTVNGSFRDQDLDDTWMQVNDIVVRNIGPGEMWTEEQEFYAAFQVSYGGLELERAVVTHVPNSALNVYGGSTLAISDFDVSDVYASATSEDYIDGRGVVMFDSRGTLDRVRTRDNGSHAVVLTASSMTVRDLIIENNRGRGLTAQHGSEIGAERVWLNNNQGIGFYVNVGGGMTLSDVAVTSTATLPCDQTLCDTPSEGFGVGLYDDAELTIERFSLAQNHVVGLAINGGTLLASNGTIADQLIGVNIASGDFDINEAFDNVLPLNNVVDVDTRQLTVPALVEELPGQTTEEEETP